MEITFPNTVMPKVTALGTVSYQSYVNDEYLWCEVSHEALRIHFGAGSMENDDLLKAFYTGREQIEQVTRRCLQSNGGRAVLLLVVDF